MLTSTFPRWRNDTTPPFVFELAKRLTTSFHIHVLAPHDRGAKPTESLEGVHVSRFRYFWPDAWEILCYRGGIMPNIRKRPWLVIEALCLFVAESIAAATLVHRHRFDMIHAHWILPQGIVAMLLKHLYGIPYIITAHGADVYGLNSPMLLSLKKRVVENADRVIVVSHDLKKTLQERVGTEIPIEVLPMGVDSVHFSPTKRDPTLRKFYHSRGPLLLYVGRLTEKKGIAYLLRAVPRIAKQFPTSRLLIVGEGPQKSELEELRDSLNLTEQVVFTGAIPNDDLPRYYASADLFIGPSIQTADGDSEGLGLTFVEAALSGCIPIGTTAGGIRDAITNGKTGFLVPEKNADAISRTAIMLLSQPMLRKKIQRELPTVATTFDWRVIVKKYGTLYQTHLHYL